MEPVTIENPLDSLIAHIATAIHQWKAENTPERIGKTVKEKLDKNATEVLTKLMGFNKSSWDNRWELDHCNGRSGESSAGDYIRKHQAEAIEEWLSKVAMPGLSPKITKDLEESCQKDYQLKFERVLRERVNQKATRDAEELLKAITTPTQLDNYLKALALIENKPTEN